MNELKTEEKLLVPAAEAARFLSIGRSTFWGKVKAGELPQPTRVLGPPRWSVAQLKEVRAAKLAAQRELEERAAALAELGPPPKPIKLRPGAFHLYRHFDAQGVLLYVGVSLSAIARLCQHRTDAAWFHEIARVELQGYATREDSLLAERIAIQAERPLHNTIWADYRKAA